MFLSGWLHLRFLDRALFLPGWRILLLDIGIVWVIDGFFLFFHIVGRGIGIVGVIDGFFLFFHIVGRGIRVVHCLFLLLGSIRVVWVLYGFFFFLLHVFGRIRVFILLFSCRQVSAIIVFLIFLSISQSQVKSWLGCRLFFFQRWNYYLLL